MRLAVLRDPFVLTYLVIVTLLSVATLGGATSLLPVSEEVRSFLFAYAEVPFIGIAIAAFLITRASVRAPIERRFWLLFAIGFGLTGPVHMLALAHQQFQDYRVDLIQDTCLIGYYVAISLALEARLVASPGDTYRDVRRVRSAGTVLFLLGLYTYFVLIPGTRDRAVYDSWVPSFFLYLVLNLHLLVRVAGLLRLTESPTWRATYRLLAAAFTGWTLLDLTELLHYGGSIDLTGMWQVDYLWFLPYLPLLCAVRLQRDGSEESRVVVQSRLARIPVLITQPLFYAVVFPGLHIAASALQLTSDSIREERELLVLAMLPVLAVLSFLHHRLLERENSRLEEEQVRVAENAQRSQRMEAIGRLAGGIAHDFNNLLQVIRGSAELLVGRVDPDSRAKRNAEDIRRATERAARLTDQLLSVGHRRHLDARPVDVNAVLRAVASMLDRILGDDVRLETAVSKEPCWARVDAALLEQALLNLAVNARDAMPEGGTLVLETARVQRSDATDVLVESSTEWSMIQVRDDGTGMDEATKAMIFEPFFTTKEEGKGTGLGLSMVYGFVHQSQGLLEVESELGIGTTFRVLLPALEGELPAPAPEEAPHDVLVPHAPPRDGRTVLLVEDEEGVRSVIRELLQDAGFHVREADTGEEALRILDGGLTPDLLLTDVLMPGMRGPELVARVQHQNPRTKILFMTGHVGSELGSAQMTDVPILEKPFTRTSLTQRIEEVLVASRE